MANTVDMDLAFSGFLQPEARDGLAKFERLRRHLPFLSEEELHRLLLAFAEVVDTAQRYATIIALRMITKDLAAIQLTTRYEWMSRSNAVQVLDEALWTEDRKWTK